MQINIKTAGLIIQGNLVFDREQIANYFKIGVYLWDGLNMVKKKVYGPSSSAFLENRCQS